MSDTHEERNDTSTRGAKRSRPWLVRIAFAVVIIVGVYCLSRVGFQLWMHARLPHDAPRIAFSLDDTWLNELGITDSTYQQALTRVGGRLIRFEPDAAGSPEVDAEALEALLDREQIDGVLLTGGGDVDPELYGGNPNGSMMINRLRDDFEIALIRAAKARGIPVLGICRGCQILNVAFGGTLRNLRADEELKKAHFTFAGHPVELAQGSRLAEVTGDIRLDNVHSFHGQAVDKPGAGVSIVATGPGGIVEAIEVEPDDDDCWIVGVQWHPEMAVNDAIQNRLFRAFVRRAAACRR